MNSNSLQINNIVQILKWQSICAPYSGNRIWISYLDICICDQGWTSFQRCTICNDLPFYALVKSDLHIIHSVQQTFIQSQALIPLDAAQATPRPQLPGSLITKKIKSWFMAIYPIHAWLTRALHTILKRNKSDSGFIPPLILNKRWHHTYTMYRLTMPLSYSSSQWTQSA